MSDQMLFGLSVTQDQVGATVVLVIVAA